MGEATRQVQELAHGLLAHEAHGSTTPEQAAAAAERMWGRLRAQLVPLVGLNGFVALLSRALALARAETPRLGGAHVAPDGALQGVRAAGPGQDAERETEDHAAVLAQFIGLLVLFTGAALTARILSGVWPGTVSADAMVGSEERAEG